MNAPGGEEGTSEGIVLEILWSTAVVATNRFGSEFNLMNPKLDPSLVPIKSSSRFTVIREPDPKSSLRFRKIWPEPDLTGPQHP